MMKGSIQDLALAIVGLIGFVFTLFLSFIIYDGFFDTLQASNITITNETQDIINSGSTSISLFITSIPIMIIAIGIGAIVLALFIPTHPVFLPASIVALIIYITLSIIFTNVVWEFITSDLIIGTANQFPQLVLFIQYFPYVIGVMGTLLIIVMYSKKLSLRGDV